jgi:hypothetical protein
VSEQGKVTPGPWEVRNSTDIFTKLGAPRADGYRARSDDGWQVADCATGLTLTEDNETARLRPEEQAANARLMAAAPQLVEALDHPCLRELFGAIEDSGTPEADRLWGLCQAWFGVRDAALKAARGEQP